MLINGTTAGKSAQHKYISLIEQLGMAATMPMPVGLRGFFHRRFTESGHGSGGAGRGIMRHTKCTLLYRR
jgi:hypothetical protein